MHINPKLAYVIVIAILLRCGLLYYNYVKHSFFFDRDPAQIQAEIETAPLPYVNLFGFEVSNIAYSIVCKKEGFASPFGGSTGPTAWTAPGGVMIYCAAFKLFGCFSTGALLSMFGVAMVLSILIIVLSYKTSLLLFKSNTVALLSAFIFAISMKDSELFFKFYQLDFNIYSFFFLLLFYIFLKYFTRNTLKRLLLFSLCAGIALLFCPILISTIVFSLALNAAITKQGQLRACGHACLCLAVISCIIGPYILYQKGRVGVYGFVKSNGAFEIYQGNSPLCDGYLNTQLFKQTHPSQNKLEYELYGQMGEADYVRSKRAAFVEEFDLNRFIKTTVKRFIFFFFQYRHPYDKYTMNIWTLLRFLGYIVPGICLIVFPMLCPKLLNRNILLAYTYIFAYALPYLLVAVMYRYSFPVSTLTCILIGAILHKVFEPYFTPRQQGAAARRPG